jgi:hypothetical protein
VEAQLFIQTPAISSYSSRRAGRIVGGGIEWVLGSGFAIYSSFRGARETREPGIPRKQIQTSLRDSGSVRVADRPE